jgi:hypothetical protein
VPPLLLTGYYTPLRINPAKDTDSSENHLTPSILEDYLQPLADGGRAPGRVIGNDSTLSPLGTVYINDNVSDLQLFRLPII